jgi:hypothetical protein
MRQRVVAVFGGHAPAPGSADYEMARELGRRLAEAGFIVMSGGYGGTMEAVSRGARESRRARHRGHGGPVRPLGVEGQPLSRCGDQVPHALPAPALPGDRRRRHGRPARRHRDAERDGHGLEPPPDPGAGPPALSPDRTRWRRLLEAYHDPLYIREEDLGLLQVVESVEEAVLRLQAMMAEGTPVGSGPRG